MDYVKKLMLIIGLLSLNTVLIHAEDCDIMAFQTCVSQVQNFADGYSFHVASATELEESCRTKEEAVKCVHDFVAKCMKRADKEVFKVTTGGKLKLVEQLCTEGTSINRGYLENLDCWERLVNDTVYCNENFEKSQQILMQEDMIERLRMFHSCCAYDWLKNCKSKAAEAKCSSDAKEYLEEISTLLGGKVLSQLCGTSFSSCYQLYGVDVEDLDERYSNIDNFSSVHYPSILISLLSFLLATFFQ